MPSVSASDGLQVPAGFAPLEAGEVFLAVSPDPEFQPLRERVHDADADAMKATGHLVGILVELAAGMELGHDDLGCGHAFLRMYVDRNSPSVVRHRHA